MIKKYVLVLVVVVVAIIVAYGVYHSYSSGESLESEYSDTFSAGVDDSGTPTTNTSNATTPNEQKTDNKTNRSTVSIPLEKPPFID